MVSKFQITIVGLGVVGTSVGLAIKRVTDDVTIVGHDKEHTIAGEARKCKAVDRTEWNLISACEKADVVVIATPFDAIEGTLRAIGPHLQPDSLVMDTATLKEPVLAWAEESLGQEASFVGGDPIILAEVIDREGAHAEFFSGATFCLCPAPSAAPAATERAANLVAALGASPYFIDAVEHDSLMAAVAHLPVVLSAAMLNSVSGAESWREMAHLGGAVFSHSTWPIGSDSATQSSLFWANRENLLRRIHACREQLDILWEALSSEDSEALSAALGQASEARSKWLAGEVEPKPDFPEYRGGIGEMFLGRLGRRT